MFRRFGVAHFISLLRDLGQSPHAQQFKACVLAACKCTGTAHQASKSFRSKLLASLAMVLPDFLHDFASLFQELSTERRASPGQPRALAEAGGASGAISGDSAIATIGQASPGQPHTLAEHPNADLVLAVDTAISTFEQASPGQPHTLAELPNAPVTLAVDIDGTVADITWRVDRAVKQLALSGRDQDRAFWDTLLDSSQFGRDVAVPLAAPFLRSWVHAVQARWPWGGRLAYVSGRREGQEEATREWLSTNSFPDGSIVLRPRGAETGPWKATALRRLQEEGHVVGYIGDRLEDMQAATEAGVLGYKVEENAWFCEADVDDVFDALLVLPDMQPPTEAEVSGYKTEEHALLAGGTEAPAQGSAGQTTLTDCRKTNSDDAVNAAFAAGRTP